MSITSINSAIKQMEAMAKQAGSQVPAAPGGTTDGAPSFSGALKASLDKVNALQVSATSQSRHFQAGAPGLELHDVMLDNQKAGLAFEMSVKVRNKMVMAYQDIMKMPV